MSKQRSNTEPGSDLISRQAAIDGFYEMASDMDHLCTVGDYISFLKSLSAQPEIIRCKDCKYSSPNKVYGCRIHSFADDLDERMYSYDFCSFAERRSD